MSQREVPIPMYERNTSQRSDAGLPLQDLAQVMLHNMACGMCDFLSVEI